MFFLPRKSDEEHCRFNGNVRYDCLHFGPYLEENVKQSWRFNCHFDNKIFATKQNTLWRPNIVWLDLRVFWCLMQYQIDKGIVVQTLYDFAFAAQARILKCRHKALFWFNNNFLFVPKLFHTDFIDYT